MNKKRAPNQKNSRALDDRELMFSLINTGRAIEQNLEYALMPVGLSLAKFGALTHLVEAGEPLSLSECAEKMTCVRSNVTQLMDRLEADGMVRRVRDREDRRVVRAALTPTGVKRQAAGAAEVAKVQADLFERMRDTSRGSLRRVLSEIN